jgi:hypothetical protein
MSTPDAHYPSHQSLNLLSRLLFQGCDPQCSKAGKAQLKQDLVTLTRPQFDDLLELAQLNHVVARGMEVVRYLSHEEGDPTRAEWSESALAAEKARIETAVSFLSEICEAFETHEYGVTVIKSLDHWPDLGSDLDLYTDASPEDVCRLMKRRFDAHIEPRSWGDRLACKWNFMLPGLLELVEIHVGRLGQTGEQVEIASSVLKRSRQVQIGDRSFRVPSISERLMISTLQRMYRHFYFRLCDMADSAGLVEMGMIDYADLRSAARKAGIWKGVATYLQIVSDFVKSYRGRGLELPHLVTSDVQFDGSEVYYARGFVRVPIMPQSARLYTSQLAGVLGKGKLQNGARLSLLPWLATAAVVGQKLTGSDKGIW